MNTCSAKDDEPVSYSLRGPSDELLSCWLNSWPVTYSLKRSFRWALLLLFPNFDLRWALLILFSLFSRQSAGTEKRWERSATYHLKEPLFGELSSLSPSPPLHRGLLFPISGWISHLRPKRYLLVSSLFPLQRERKRNFSRWRATWTWRFPSQSNSLGWASQGCLAKTPSPSPHPERQWHRSVQHPAWWTQPTGNAQNTGRWIHDVVFYKSKWKGCPYTIWYAIGHAKERRKVDASDSQSWKPLPFTLSGSNQLYITFCGFGYSRELHQRHSHKIFKQLLMNSLKVPSGEANLASEDVNN